MEHSSGVIKEAIIGLKQKALKLTLFFMIVSPLTAYASCHISLAVDSYPPYQIYEDKTWRGLDVEMASALIEKIGCKLVIKKFPWKRSLHLLEKGKIDMMVSMSKNHDRQKFTSFIGPMRQELVALVVNKNRDLQLTNLDDIKNIDKKVGIINGAFYGDEFANKYKNDPEFKRKFEVSNNTQENIVKLNGGRIAGFLNDPVYVNYLITKTNTQSSVYFHPLVINQDPVYFGFSKKSVAKQMLIKIQNAFNMLNDDGTFILIRKKFSQVAQ